MNNVDQAYFDLLKLILRDGRTKHNRTGVDTVGVFGAQAKFNLSEGFPILTTKKVFMKGIIHELLWFLKGDTNIKYLVDNDVHIWDEWGYKRYVEAHKANAVVDGDRYFRYFDKDGNRVATKEEAHTLSMYQMEDYLQRIKEDPEFARVWGDLGEGTYGGMWREFPVNHQKNDGKKILSVDQIATVIEKLKINPDDRRMIVSAWHPYWVDYCALPPCHCMFHFNTEELTIEERANLLWLKIDAREHSETFYQQSKAQQSKQCDEYEIPKRRLNLLLYQRSCDTFLGVPFNISSYSLLLAMMAHVTGMEPGTFTHTYGDLHIYKNHMGQIMEQLSRDPLPLPRLWLNPEIRDLFNFKYDDIKLLDYKSHPPIKGAVAV